MWLCGSPLPDYIRSIRPKRYLDNWSFRDMDIYMYWEFGFANSSRGFKHTMVLPSSSISGMWHMTCTYIIFVCEQIQSSQKLYEHNYIYICILSRHISIHYYADLSWISISMTFHPKKQLAGKHCTHMGTWCKLTSKVVYPIRLSRQSSHDVIIPKKHEHYNIYNYPWGFLKSWGIPSRHHGFQYKVMLEVWMIRGAETFILWVKQ